MVERSYSNVIKEACIVNVERLIVILLLEVDFNTLYKIILMVDPSWTLSIIKKYYNLFST